ncbi:uncharacterized protein LOC114526908 [Dendronephthya gigantea]|uniref:uncharacterized protein LOC114526908 n=1 Tax=Dendronephthya gigantea TaxID=151771 RepID=UPI00106D66C8|nr:uncharacterized protein LOC114526908 [Dendronephthya gigantea]XP_028404252.1 uncharacterized protein LOC114526908 [Dendronephthya gigantea]
MARAMSTYCRIDDDIHISVSIEEISKDRKYREQKKHEVAIAVCALFNSNGGTVEIRGEETEGNLDSTTILDSLIRTLEQSLMSRFGAQITELVSMHFEDQNAKKISIKVSKARFLATVNSNLYRPTQKQVALIDNVLKALKIMNRRFVDQPVQLGSHQKKILKNQNCCLRENEVTQFKHLKSDSSKRFTLADRMIGKSNKFSCYVSAFANHRGGHIYYGIDDDGVVHGENTENIPEIEKKVEKAIQKMIWPDVIGQPKRGEHWEIFFEPVLDENSNLIPSTFVIVIFIAPCCGGVFTEEPESYEMVGGKVEKMSFTTWKKKLQPVGLNKRKQEVPPTVKRISLSPAAKKCCHDAYEGLTEATNNGDRKLFTIRVSELELKYPDNPEVQSVVLSKRVIVNYRQGNFSNALSLLNEFQECVPRTEQPLVLEVHFCYLKTAMARVSGKTDESRDISTDALTKVEGVGPGLFTAALYLVLASIYDDSQNDARLSPDILCTKALEQLEYVEDAPVTRADLFHNAHITLATFHLGYNLSVKMIKKDIDKESLQKAQDSIMAVNQSLVKGNPLAGYRKISFILAQSILYIRHSELEPEKQTRHLKTAFNFAKEAENLVKHSGLVEMVCWAQTAIASCTEALLLAMFRKTKNIRVFKVKVKVQGAGYIATV